MNYYGNNDFRVYYQKTNEHLAHFGIIGMKWVIRRFHPIPFILVKEENVEKEIKGETK